jgi:hypothetical protein
MLAAGAVCTCCELGFVCKIHNKQRMKRSRIIHTGAWLRLGRIWICRRCGHDDFFDVRRIRIDGGTSVNLIIVWRVVL